MDDNESGARRRARLVKELTVTQLSALLTFRNV